MKCLNIAVLGLFVSAQANADLSLPKGDIPLFPDPPTREACRSYGSQLHTLRQQEHNALQMCYNEKPVQAFDNNVYVDCHGNQSNKPYPGCHSHMFRLCQIKAAYDRLQECRDLADQAASTPSGIVKEGAQTALDAKLLVKSPQTLASKLLAGYIKRTTQRRLDQNFGDPLSSFQADELTNFVDTYVNTGQRLAIRNSLVSNIVGMAFSDLAAHRERLHGEVDRLAEILDYVGTDDTRAEASMRSFSQAPRRR